MEAINLKGCEIICIGESFTPTDLIDCPLTTQDQNVCKERRQYLAGIREVAEWVEKHFNDELGKCHYYRFEDYQWQAKLKEWGIEDGS